MNNLCNITNLKSTTYVLLINIIIIIIIIINIMHTEYDLKYCNQQKYFSKGFFLGPTYLPAVPLCFIPFILELSSLYLCGFESMNAVLRIANNRTKALGINNRKMSYISNNVTSRHKANHGSLGSQGFTA